MTQTITIYTVMPNYCGWRWCYVPATVLFEMEMICPDKTCIINPKPKRPCQEAGSFG